jgi:hypothetical protein
MIVRSCVSPRRATCVVLEHVAATESAFQKLKHTDMCGRRNRRLDRLIQDIILGSMTDRYVSRLRLLEADRLPNRKLADMIHASVKSGSEIAQQNRVIVYESTDLRVVVSVPDREARKANAPTVPIGDSTATSSNTESNTARAATPSDAATSLSSSSTATVTATSIASTDRLPSIPKNHYCVELVLQRDVAGICTRTKCYCTCPSISALLCKHIWAAVFCTHGSDWFALPPNAMRDERCDAPTLPDVENSDDDGVVTVAPVMSTQSFDPTLMTAFVRHVDDATSTLDAGQREAYLSRCVYHIADMRKANHTKFRNLSTYTAALANSDSKSRKRRSSPTLPSTSASSHAASSSSEPSTTTATAFSVTLSNVSSANPSSRHAQSSVRQEPFVPANAVGRPVVKKSKRERVLPAAGLIPLLTVLATYAPVQSASSSSASSSSKP